MNDLQNLSDIADMLDSQAQMLDILESQEEQIGILLCEKASLQEQLDESMSLNETLNRQIQNYKEALKTSEQQIARLTEQIRQLETFRN